MKTPTEVANEFQEYLNYKTPWSYTTKNNYANIVKRFLNHMINKNKKIAFTIEDINRWVVNKNAGNNSAHTYKYAMKHFLTFLGKKDWIEQLAPVRKQPRKKTFVYIPHQTVIEILNKIPSKQRSIAWLQYKTGMRFREALTIQCERIDWNKENDVVCIDVSEYTKGKKFRTVYLNKQNENILRRITNNKTYGFPFIESNKVNMNNEKELENYFHAQNNALNEQLSKIAKAYGINGFSSHYLRHLFADNFKKAGGDVDDLKDILGHSDPKTTYEYISRASSKGKSVVANMV